MTEPQKDATDERSAVRERLGLEPLMTIAEAAEYLGISPYTLRDKVTRGEVPHTRILGNRHGVRFTAAHLAAIVAAGEQPVVRRLRSAPRTRL